jgi:DNA-directed RNA polymerase subunit K/omega
MKVTTDNKDNKYSKVLIIEQHAKRLHNGLYPRIPTLKTSHTCIAIEEVERNIASLSSSNSPSKIWLGRESG